MDNGIKCILLVVKGNISSSIKLKLKGLSVKGSDKLHDINFKKPFLKFYIIQCVLTCDLA